MPDVLTAREAADYLQISPSMLLREARAGVIPGKKIGRQWRFSRPALLGWLEEEAAAQAEDRARVAAIKKGHGEPEDH